MVKVWITLFCLTLVIAVGAVRGLQFLNNPPSAIEQYKVIEIPEGAPFNSVSDLLKREGLITNRIYFRLLGLWTQSEKKIKPGEYALHTAMRPMELLDLLVRGKILQHQVVIPEGITARQIAKIFEEAKLADADAFMKVVEDPTLMAEFGIEGESLEGYLFPDTYQFAKRTPPHEKMRLQSDPTVIFALTDFNGNLTKKDLSAPSPYNTYRFIGLPPGPIANPGKESLYAALYPANVDYLYFVSKNDGTHFFSKNLREHNGAVNKYQRRRA